MATKKAMQFKKEALRAGIQRKGRMLKRAKVPRWFHETAGQRTLGVVKALHRFREKTISWGSGKKKGEVKVIFKPVHGYRTVSMVEEEMTKVQFLRKKQPADHMYGFEDWLGFAVRFMAYPAETETKKFGRLYRLDSYEWPKDFVTAAKGAFGYIGCTATFVGREERPTLFIQAVEIRNAYFDLTNPKYARLANAPDEVAARRAIKKRYSGWAKRWVQEVERQARQAGFARVAWIPSTNPFFSNPGVRVQPETKKALYKDWPEEMGYEKETLSVPATNGMKKVRYYAKGLGN